MSGVIAARQQLVELLRGNDGAGGAMQLVHEHVPEQPIPPCWIVQPADDFVSEDPDATFAGELLISFDVVLLVELVDNETAGAELDQALSDLLDAVRPSGWWIRTINQPGGLHTTDWIHHGVRVTVTSRIEL